MTFIVACRSSVQVPPGASRKENLSRPRGLARIGVMQRLSPRQQKAPIIGQSLEGDQTAVACSGLRPTRPKRRAMIIENGTIARPTIWISA